MEDDIYELIKLKLSLQNIEGAEVLTRQQLKMVMGGSGEGGTCRYHYTNGVTMYSECMSKAEAQAGAQQAGQIYPDAKWCCDSCVSAGYPAC